MTASAARENKLPLNCNPASKTNSIDRDWPVVCALLNCERPHHASHLSEIFTVTIVKLSGDNCALSSRICAAAQVEDHLIVCPNFITPSLQSEPFAPTNKRKFDNEKGQLGEWLYPISASDSLVRAANVRGASECLECDDERAKGRTRRMQIQMQIRIQMRRQKTRRQRTN